MRKLMAALAASFLLAAPASAHLAGGEDAFVDGYMLDIGFDPNPLVAGKIATFAFNLLEVAPGITVEPEAVWVRIFHDGEIVFVGTLKPSQGNATMQVMIPKAGDYEMDARFTYMGKELETAYHFTAKSDRGAEAPVAGIVLVGLSIAGAAGFFLGRRRMRARQ